MSNGRRYAVSFEGQSVTNANGDCDLFEISPAANKPVRLLGLVLCVTSEVGDAQDEVLRIAVRRVPATATSSNGTAATPRPLNSNEAAASASAETLGATVATSTGTIVDLLADGFNVRSGYQFWWTPETCPVFFNGELAVVRLMAAVADDVTMSGTLYFEEL